MGKRPYLCTVKTKHFGLMKKIFAIMMLLPLMAQGQTLEECQQAAERNYPLIRQYGLIEQTTALTLSNLAKGWLPQVTASAQATLQSDVVEWPDQMQTIYQQMGLDMKGLKKDQYKVGLDVQQMLFDGGVISSQRDIAREQGRVEQAQAEVTMYQVRRRVNEMFFGLLMLDEQIQLNRDLQQLLDANEKKLESMWKRGTASESDYQAVKAERLNVVQQATTLDAQRRAVTRMLSAFCGMEVTQAEKPALIALPSTDVVQRPELKAIDAQLSLAGAQERALNAALRPKLSLFASGFYGYPGYNMFEDMMSHDWSWNGMVGARLTWNLGAFYTHRSDKAKLRLQRDMAETSRDVFLFNNRLEQIQQNENIEQYRRLMTDDEEIIALRASVRKAAESKLAHGIIDVNDLVKEINAENAARLQQSIHEIKLLKEVYDLKFTTNN